MKEEIVKRLLREGIMVSPEDLKEINEDNVEDFLKKRKEEAVLGEEKKTGKASIEIREIHTKPKLSTSDFAKYYNNKYEGIKKILLKKTEAISINNAKKSFSEVSVIGMVAEGTQNGFFLEDTTGTIEVIARAELGKDDVVCVKGGVREGKLFANEIILPDIPLSGAITRMENTNLFLMKKPTGTQKQQVRAEDFLIAAEDGGKKRENSVTNIPNPAQIKIQRDGKTINVLVYKPSSEAGPKQVLEWLKKRHLSPKMTEIRSQEDPYLIEPVPGVFWVVSGKEWTENYKGVLVVSTDKGAKINLNTRETEFLE